MVINIYDKIHSIALADPLETSFMWWSWSSESSSPHPSSSCFHKKNLIIFNSLPFFKPLLDFIQCTMLTRMKRPITSLDFCYSGESETVSVQVFHQNLLQDFRKRVKNSKFPKFQECVSICAMVAAYDSGTTRANEMLTVLDAILPLFLKQIVQDKKTEVTVLICFF